MYTRGMLTPALKKRVVVAGSLLLFQVFELNCIKLVLSQAELTSNMRHSLLFELDKVK